MYARTPRIGMFGMTLVGALAALQAGTQIEISSIEELQQIGKHADYPLDGEYVLVEDIDASDTADWNDGAGFDPIGNEDDRFAGVFNGQGHVIKGLTIDRPDEEDVGLFGATGESGELRDIGLENAHVTGHSKVGGLVGESRGEISQSYARGVMRGELKVGGLVGSSTGPISKSYATGDVTGAPVSESYVLPNVPASLRGGMVGGLVGFSQGDLISKSYATGDVRGDGDNLGGLAGLVLAGAVVTSVSESYATGDVRSDGDNVGGLVGHNAWGTVSQSFAMGTVRGRDSVGGLVGYNRAGYATVRQSYATGDVKGDSRVGGLVGQNLDGRVSESYARGMVGGDSSVGGLVGGMWRGTITSAFWDTEASGSTVDVGRITVRSSASEDGTGLATGEMLLESTFADAGWDFDEVWGIREGVSYPYLQAMPQNRQPIMPRSGVADRGWVIWGGGGLVILAGGALWWRLRKNPTREAQDATQS